MAARVKNLHEALGALIDERNHSIHHELKDWKNLAGTVAALAMLTCVVNKSFAVLENEVLPVNTQTASKPASDPMSEAMQHLYKAANAKGKVAIEKIASDHQFSKAMKDSSHYANKDFSKITEPRAFYKVKTGLDFSDGELNVINTIAKLGGKNVVEKFATLKRAGIDFELTNKDLDNATHQQSAEFTKASSKTDSSFLRVDAYSSTEFNVLYDKVQHQLTAKKLADHPDLLVFKQEGININNTLLQGAEKSNYAKWVDKMNEKDSKTAHTEDHDSSVRM